MLIPEMWPPSAAMRSCRSAAISGTKARRPGLDALLRDAGRGRFDLVLVCGCDRIARSTKHFLQVLDELRRLNLQFVSFREQIDTGGPLGKALLILIGAFAELERSLIVERVRAGMPAPVSRARTSADRRSNSPPSHLKRPPARPEPGPDRQSPPHLPHHHLPRAARADDQPGAGRMKALPVALLAIIVAAATVAEVFHALRRRAQDSQLRQIPAALDQQLAETRPTERTCTGYATPSTRCTSTSIPCQKERRKLPPKPLKK